MMVSVFISPSVRAGIPGTDMFIDLHRAPMPEEDPLEPLPGEEPAPDDEEEPPHPDPSARH